jgi:hypothetical protein
MDTRHYLVSDEEVYAIWEATPEQIIKMLKDKPQFELVGPPWGGYPTRPEAEAARQLRQNSK